MGEEEGREYVEGLPVDIPFREICVLRGEGVEEAFDVVVRRIIDKFFFFSSFFFSSFFFFCWWWW